MKKTLMVNLGGIVFHIDEDAFILLNQYLESLKRHFSPQEGSQDILDDIESRMAEIFNGKITGTKQVICVADVEEVITIMGRPSEIGQESENGNGHGARSGTRRLYRNPGERIIGGVCAGLASYLHLDPVWVRLAFILITMAFGSGVLIYLVFWVIIPEAQTTTEKLEMQGRRVNVRSIEQSIREEVSGIGNKIGDMAGESAQTIRRAGTATAPVIRTIGNGLAEILRVIGKILLVGFGIVLVLFSLGIIAALLAYILGWTGGFIAENGITLLDFPNFAGLLVGCDMPVYYLQLIILIVIGVPLVMLLYNGIRMIFPFKRVKNLWLVMLNVWIVGLFFMFWAILRIYGMYKFEDHNRMTIPLENPVCDTLNISLIPQDPGMKYIGNDQYLLIDDIHMVFGEKREMCLMPVIHLETSDDSLVTITQSVRANGRSRNEAHQHLAEMRFSVSTHGDTLLVSPFVMLPPGRCWRGQYLDLVIRVPKNKYVRFFGEIERLSPYHSIRVPENRDAVYRMTDFGMELEEGKQ